MCMTKRLERIRRIKIQIVIRLMKGSRHLLCCLVRYLVANAFALPIVNVPRRVFRVLKIHVE